jgi:hypothetical protein
MSKVRQTFVPDQEGGGIKIDRRNNTADVILKLAAIDAYNADREIRGSDGSFMPGTDVVLLTSYTLQPEPLVRGKSEFVKLMLQAGIPTSMIANENMKIFIPMNPPAPPPPPPPPVALSMPTLAQMEATLEQTRESTPENTEYTPESANETTPDPPEARSMPILAGPFPPGPNTARKRGRPPKTLPAMPVLQGPYHQQEAHEIPLPKPMQKRTEPVKRTAEVPIPGERPEKRNKQWHTIADLDDDE